MRSYDRMLAGVVAGYLCFAFLLYSGYGRFKDSENLEYKAEINAVMQELVSRGDFYAVDLSGFLYLKELSFLPQEKAGDPESLADFYRNHGGVHSSIQPLVVRQKLEGFVRFDYLVGTAYEKAFLAAEGTGFAVFLFVMGILVYVRVKILAPFHVIGEMPYELAKGHLTGSLNESKNRYFGKFLWGLSMLRDALSDARAKELWLMREKRLLLLALSHDIKSPLSAIRLYAKALRENIYDTQEEFQFAAAQIEAHVQEIDSFVKEIMKASSGEILSIEVENTEFYLKDYVEKVLESYAPKCRLLLLDFTVGTYENHLLKGDPERAFEAMENLLENALKYGDGVRISVDFYEEDYCQVIRVFNSGKPVDTAELPHLFDSFYRGSNAGAKQGNGLGLYISRQIMRKMEGDIFAQRCEDGMIFCLVFQM